MSENTTPEQLTDEELICALIEGSIGYYSPASASLTVRDFRNGHKECWSERCMALYDCDLKKMVEADVRKWTQYTSDARKERVRAMVRAWAKLPDMEQTAVGLAFPTMA